MKENGRIFSLMEKECRFIKIGLSTKAITVKICEKDMERRSIMMEAYTQGIGNKTENMGKAKL